MRDWSVVMEVKSGRASSSVRWREETCKGRTRIVGVTYLGNLELSMEE